MKARKWSCEVRTWRQGSGRSIHLAAGFRATLAATERGLSMPIVDRIIGRYSALEILEAGERLVAHRYLVFRASLIWAARESIMPSQSTRHTSTSILRAPERSRRPVASCVLTLADLRGPNRPEHAGVPGHPPGSAILLRRENSVELVQHALNTAPYPMPDDRAGRSVDEAKPSPANLR